MLLKIINTSLASQLQNQPQNDVQIEREETQLEDDLPPDI